LFFHLQVKNVVIVAGKSRHLDWYTAMGDAMATNEFQLDTDTREAQEWLSPALNSAAGNPSSQRSKAGSKLSGYIKEFVGAVEDLPDDAAAAGIRAGACTMLMEQLLPFQAVAVSGAHVANLFLLGMRLWLVLPILVCALCAQAMIW
jgi:hypothetical protein